MTWFWWGLLGTIGAGLWMIWRRRNRELELPPPVSQSWIQQHSYSKRGY